MDEMEKLKNELAGRWPWNLAMAAARIGARARMDVFRVYAPGVPAAVEDAGLSERELKALEYRYRDGGMTLEACGALMGVTRERARQVIDGALRKLAAPERARMFVLDAKNRTEPLKARAEALAGEVLRQEEEMEALRMEVMELKGMPQWAREHGRDTVESLGLSSRSQHCLRREGVDTLADFDGWTVERLKAVRNLGLRSLEEILGKLGELGIELPEK